MPREQEVVVCKISPMGVRVALWIFSFTGFVLSSLAISSCRFAKVVTTNERGAIDVSFVGIFNFLSSSGVCVSQSILDSSPETPDASSSLQAARAFGVLSAVVGGITTVWMVISLLFTGTNKPLWLTMASLLAVAAAFQLIVFIAFNDDKCKDDQLNEAFVECTVDEGSAFAVSAAIFYLLACIGTFIVAHPRTPIVGFEEGWRAGGGAKVGGGGGGREGNGAVAHTPVVVHQEERPYISSTTPPTGTFRNNQNLRNAGATVSAAGVEGDFPEEAAIRGDPGVEL